MNKQFTISEEHMTNGIVPEGISEQSQVEE